ncbi:MAG: hypothetical protein II128_03360, partial [Atopobiaceae bacterium]|nr:hypothetical protein [Atopobiaceae bacterium]
MTRDLLRRRFDERPELHPGVTWEYVEQRLTVHPDALEVLARGAEDHLHVVIQSTVPAGGVQVVPKMGGQEQVLVRAVPQAAAFPALAYAPPGIKAPHVDLIRIIPFSHDVPEEFLGEKIQKIRLGDTELGEQRFLLCLLSGFWSAEPLGMLLPDGLSGGQEAVRIPRADKDRDERGTNVPGQGVVLSRQCLLPHMEQRRREGDHHHL